MSLKRAAFLGARWTTISSGIETVVQILQTIVLSRLLSPEDFGLMAIVVMVLAFLKTYADMGLSSAIVHRQDTTAQQISSLFWINIFASFAMFGVMVATSPLIAAIYNEPRVAGLISYTATVFLILPFGELFARLLQKELDFRTLAVCEVISVIVAASVTITAALEGLGVFSLVLGRISGACVTAGLFGAVGMKKWPVRFHFRRADLKGYLRFGLYQMGEHTVLFLTGRIDQLIIGILLGPQPLGYYVLAWNLVFQPVMRFGYVLTRVAFPLFARVQLETERLRRGYFALLWLLATINAPVMIGCAVTAPLFVPLFFGEKWIPAVIIIQILAFVSLIVSMMRSIGAVLLAKGRTDFALIWAACLILPEAVGVYVGIRLGGLHGVALAELWLHLLYWLAQYFLVIRIILGPCFKQYTQSVLPPLGIAALMGIIVWLWPNVFAESLFGELASKVAIGAALYVGLNFLLQRSRIYEIRELLSAGVKS